MKKEDYEDLLEEMSEQLAERIMEKEDDLAKRALQLDGDIAEQLRTLGQKASEKVLGKIRDELVKKKKPEGLRIHKNPTIEFNVIFGKIEIKSPYLYLEGKGGSKPLRDIMNITHNGRSLAVNRALTDFGSEESFEHAAKRFEEHYHFHIGPSAVDRATKESAKLAESFIDAKLAEANLENNDDGQYVEKMLIELDGCEIRTALWEKDENNEERTPAYGNPKKKKRVGWRDVRLGFVRPLDSEDKTFVGGMVPYPVVGGQLLLAAKLRGMTSDTVPIGVADGGAGLFEELKRQFPNMRFILDKPHLKDHFYDTAEQLGLPSKDRPAWVKPRVATISEGNVSTVVEELENLLSENDNDRLRRLLGYLERFKECLDYDDCQNRGYPIGSGEIESAHKYVPQKRLKIPGASWHPDSINPMLALRILKADDYWDEFWSERKETLLAA
jgi:hypothetical protein